VIISPDQHGNFPLIWHGHDKKKIILFSQVIDHLKKLPKKIEKKFFILYLLKLHVIQKKISDPVIIDVLGLIF